MGTFISRPLGMFSMYIHKRWAGTGGEKKFCKRPSWLPKTSLWWPQFLLLANEFGLSMRDWAYCTASLSELKQKVGATETRCYLQYEIKKNMWKENKLLFSTRLIYSLRKKISVSTALGKGVKAADCGVAFRGGLLAFGSHICTHQKVPFKGTYNKEVPCSPNTERGCVKWHIFGKKNVKSLSGYARPQQGYVTGDNNGKWRSRWCWSYGSLRATESINTNPDFLSNTSVCHSTS